MWKVKFDISELFIQCNKDSCYELITVGVNIYFYGCVSLLDPDSAVCLCMCVYMCVSVFVRSNQSTSKKTHGVSDLSKLIVCTHPHPLLWVESPTGKEGMTFFRGGGMQLLQKKKESLKYLTTKKVYKQKCVSVTIKNLDCEILTKNLVTFKRWDEVKDEKLWGFTKKSLF